MLSLGKNEHEKALALCYLHFKMSYLQFLTQFGASSAKAGVLPWGLATKMNHSFCCAVLPMENQL